MDKSKSGLGSPLSEIAEFLELISKILPHENRETTELHKAQEIGRVILMARQDTTKVLQPGEQPLDFPAALVPAHCPTVLRDRADSIGAVRCDQLNSLLLQLGIEFVAVVGLVPDQSFRRIGNKPVFNSIFDKGELSRI